MEECAIPASSERGSGHCSGTGKGETGWVCWPKAARLSLSADLLTRKGGVLHGPGFSSHLKNKTQGDFPHMLFTEVLTDAHSQLVKRNHKNIFVCQLGVT